MINWRKHYKKGLIAIGILLSTSALYNAQEGDPAKGQSSLKQIVQPATNLTQN